MVNSILGKKEKLLNASSGKGKEVHLNFIILQRLFNVRIKIFYIFIFGISILNTKYRYIKLCLNIIKKNAGYKMKQKTSELKDNYYYSIFFMLFASFCFAIVPIIIKSLDEIPLMEVVFFRNFVSMLVIPVILFWRKIPIYGNNKKFLILRGIFGYLGIIGMYYAYTKMPIIDAVAIHRISPFLIIILSSIILKENTTFNHIFIILLAFLGALIVIKPGFRVDVLPVIIALLATLCVSISHIIIRYLRHTDNFLVIINYFSYISGILAIFFLIQQKNFIIPKSLDLIKLLLIGIISIGAQLGVTISYQYAPANKVSVYLYTQILFAAMLELIFFGVLADFLSITGASLVLLAGIINFFYNRAINIVK